MYKITRKEHGGMTLLEALRAVGAPVDAPCGGKGTCGKCRVLADGEPVLACRTAVERDMTVQVPRADSAVLTHGGRVAADGCHSYALAYDLGTTTVVCCLIDGKTGEILARAGCDNPQTAYGADVISRIEYVMKTGTAELRLAAEKTMETLGRQVACGKEITMVSVAGNTAMHHLLLGLDPKPLTVPPYMPKSTEAVEKEGLRVLPNIAGFVGGDTVACMLSTGFDTREKTTLLIDIGTNGEMVLGDRHGRLACSTAAGPAFEGAGIACGMRGAEGAVDHVWIENGRLCWSVIGGGEAKGLCGSGLLDLVACLLQLGVISEMGRMDCETYYLGDTGVYLTRKDVREVQLAKGAIRAGIALMCSHRGIGVEQIEEVLLAGAFGNYLTPASACAIGMIPPCLEEKILPVGNAAGMGAAMCAARGEAFETARRLAAETEFLELASKAEFQDLFVDCLSFEEDEDD